MLYLHALHLLVEIHCEILLRREGTGAVAATQHYFNNEEMLD